MAFSFFKENPFRKIDLNIYTLKFFLGLTLPIKDSLLFSAVFYFGL